MVEFDLNIKKVIGLAEYDDSIDEKELREHLEKFKKEDFIEYLVKETIQEETTQEDTPENKPVNEVSI